MGFIKGSLLVFVSIILLIVLLLGSTFLVLSSSLKYKNVQKEMAPILENFTNDKLNILEGNFNLIERMEDAQKFMEEHCQNESSYIFAEGDYTFVIPCDILNETGGGTSAMVSQGIENIIEQIYYDNYNCKFWNCFKVTKLPFFLISEKAKNYWQDKFYLTLIIFGILVVLILFLTKHKQNTPIIIGSLLVISSFPLLKLEKIIGSIAGDPYLLFIGIFFNKIGSVFWIVFIMGLIFILAGIALKLLSLDFIKEIFSRKSIQKPSKKNKGKNNKNIKK